MTSIDAEKKAAARAALAYVERNSVIGVGTGSTVAHFIDALGREDRGAVTAVPTSIDTERRLRRAGIATIALADAGKPLALYVDGADEIDRAGCAIKGGGGAHVQEKLVAGSSLTWVCIVDERKLVDHIGAGAPVPLEVTPKSVAEVTAAVARLGGVAVLRVHRPTDSGNPILDVGALDLSDPSAVEDALEAIPGVIACGIFAHRRADSILVGMADGSVLTVVPG